MDIYCAFASPTPHVFLPIALLCQASYEDTNNPVVFFCSTPFTIPTLSISSINVGGKRKVYFACNFTEGDVFYPR